MDKLTTCKTCGAQIAAGAKACPSCGARQAKPIYKRVSFWVIAVLVVGIVGAALQSSANNAAGRSNATVPTGNATVSTGNAAVSSGNDAFQGSCGLTASAEMGTNILGYPELTISVTNTSGKNISAIRFYAVPYDVYGDEITGWTRQSNLYTDTTIPAGNSTTLVYSLIEDSVKTVKLYVYSVYYADGTEWGNKDATKSTILDRGALIEVSAPS